jgi:hypothetical protein
LARNTRQYPNTDERDDKEIIRKLKSQIRKLKKENKDLKSENDTLLDAWSKTESFLVEITQGVPLEDLVKVRTLPKKAVRGINPVEKKEPNQNVRKKWAEWRKENL